MNRRIRSKVAASITLVLAVALVACQGSSAQSGQQQVQTATVTRGTITATVATAGNIVAKSQVTVVFQTSGQVKTVNVAVGDKVKAGQVMATLDSTALQTALTSAQAGVQIGQAKLVQTQQGPLASQVNADQAAVASAASALQAAQAKAGHLADQLVIDQNNVNNAATALSNAQSAYSNLFEFPRPANPRGPFVPPAGQQWSSQKAALDNAQVDYNSAVATYQLDAAAVNNSGVASAQAQLASAQATLAGLQPTQQDIQLAQQAVQQAQVAYQQAEANLAKTQLIAPFDGVVADVNIQPGQQVTNSLNAVVLVDLSQLQAQVNVTESDIGRIKVGQAAQVTLDALTGQTYNAHVIEVSQAGVTTQGVVNYPVTVALDQPGTDLPIKPGMTANVNIIVEQRDNVLLVPNRAIKTSGRNRTVTVLANGKETTVNVTLGLSNDTQSEVTSGLQEGEVVVVPQTTTTNRGGPGGGIGIPGGFGR